MTSRRARLSGLLIASIFLAITAAYVVWHLGSFSDGARLEPGESSWTGEGVIVKPLVETPGGLRQGDIVAAVQGRSMGEWANALFDLGVPRPGLDRDAALSYTILRDGQRIELRVPSTAYPLGAILAKNWSTFLVTLFTQIVLTIVFLVKPLDRAPRIFFLWAWSFSHTYVWSMGLTVTDIVGGAGFWLYQLGATGAWLIFWTAGLQVTMSFMREPPLFQRHRQARVVMYLLPFAYWFGFLAISRLYLTDPLKWVGSWIVSNWVFAALLQIPTAYFMIREYRAVRDAAARRQVRWLVFGFLLSFVVGLGFWFLPGIVLGQPLIDARALGLATMPFPVIVAIAILHDRLFDIDVIIRRTLTYTLVTAVLAIVFFASVIFLQQLFAGVTGSGQNEIVTVLSTLAIAALFVPLRNRVQETIDRRFNRSKYDAQQVLNDFAKTLRDETDLERLTGRLIEVVHETMEPRSVSVWLKRTDD